MDCERIATEAGPKGPKTFAESENSIKSFAEAVENFGQTAEFFITPATAELHRALFLKLKEKGHRLSLHLHLPTYKNWYSGQKIELANLSYEKQKKVLTSAISDFKQTFGFLPEGFRPGMASANQDTTEILTELGINRGSLSIPDYVNPKYKIDWSDYPTTPHNITTKHGTLHNFPLTNNLWIDNNKSSSKLIKSIENYQDSPENSYLPIYTHNWVDFSPTTRARKRVNLLP